MEYCKKIIKEVDCYGYKPSMYTNQETKLNSFIGGIFSLLIIIASIIGMNLLGRELWGKINLVTNTSNSFNANPSPITYKEDIDFFVGVRNPSTGALFADISIYRVEAILNSFNKL
jgi:hypothetical protein